MDKKKILLLVVVIVLGLFLYLGYGVISKSLEKNAAIARIRTIPEFNLLRINNNQFEKKDLKKGMPTVFLYFGSECNFCQHEAQSIRDTIDAFNNIQLVFISTEPVEKCKVFSEKHKLQGKDNIIFLSDHKGYFAHVLNVSFIPFTIIYDKNQHLIGTHKGQLNAKSILRIINNSIN